VNAEIRREIAEFLTHQRTASLATVAADGSPHVADVWFVSDARMQLYFVSSPQAAHSQHLARDSRVALTVHAPGDDPGSIHGLQIHGTCAVIPAGMERAEIQALYMQRYPFLATAAVLLARLRTEEFYQVTPAWMRWIDNRRGFGFKVEWQAGRSGALII